MVISSSFLFKIPGQTSFMGFESLEAKHPRPDTMVEVKDIGVCRHKSSHGYGEKLGSLPYKDIKAKYAV